MSCSSIVRGGGLPLRPNRPPWQSSRYLRLLALGWGSRAALDFDAPGLLWLRQAPNKIDLEQAVGERRRINLDVISEIKTPLEGSKGNTFVEVFGLVAVLQLLTVHNQQIFLRRNVQLIWRKSCHCKRYAESVFAGPNVVVGCVPVTILGRLQVIQPIEQVLEADR